MSACHHKTETFATFEASTVSRGQSKTCILIISDSDSDGSLEQSSMSPPLQRAAAANMSASAQEILSWRNEASNRNSTSTPHPSPTEKPFVKTTGSAKTKDTPVSIARADSKAHPPPESPSSSRPTKMRRSFKPIHDIVSTAGPKPAVSTASTATGSSTVGRVNNNTSTMPSGGPAAAAVDDPFWPEHRIKSLTSMYKSELDENIVLRGKLEAAERRANALEAAKVKTDKEMADMNKYRGIIAHIKKSVDDV